MTDQMPTSFLTRRALLIGGVATAAVGSVATAQSLQQSLEQWTQKLNYSLSAGDILGAAESRIVLSSLYTSTPGVGLKGIEYAKTLLTQNMTPQVQRINPQVYAASRLMRADIILREPGAVRNRHLNEIHHAANIALQYTGHFGNITLQAARLGLASALLSGDLDMAVRWIDAGFARDKFQIAHDRSAQAADFDRAQLYEFLNLVAVYRCKRGDPIGAWRAIEDSRRYAHDAPFQDNPWITNPHSKTQTRPLSRLTERFDAVVGIAVSVAGTYAVVSKKSGESIDTQIHLIQTTSGVPFDSDILDQLTWGQPLIHAQVNTGWGGWYGTYGAIESDGRAWVSFRKYLTSKSKTWWDSYYASLHKVIPTGQGGSPSSVLLVQHSALSNFPLPMIPIPNTDRMVGDEVQFNHVPSLQQAAKSLDSKNASSQKVAGLYNPTKDLEYAEAEASLTEALVGDRFQRLAVSQSQRAGIRDLKKTDCRTLVLGTHASMVEGIALLQDIKTYTSNKRIADSRGKFAADYIVLGACESGVSGPFHNSEKLHLAHVLLREGVVGVIATKWEVDDIATSLLMAKFMENFEVNDQSPVRALANAQRWLRTATNLELESFLINLSKSLPKESYAPIVPLEALLADRINSHGESTRPFDNPYYWGGFIYYGV